MRQKEQSCSEKGSTHLRLLDKLQKEVYNKTKKQRK